MNAQIFRKNLLGVLTFYAISLIAGSLLAAFDPPTEDAAFSWYVFWKDSQTLLFAIPAAWLGYCFQRRQTYLKDVRELWSKIVSAIQLGIQYTHNEKRTPEEYSKMMASFSIAIDECRGVFSNIGESDKNVGFYPFDSLKDIQGIIAKLGYQNFDLNESTAARKLAVKLWKEKVRRAYLQELPRGIPKFPNSSYIGNNLEHALEHESELLS